MVSENDSSQAEPRTPTVDDLIHLCRKLNEAGAKYVVVGGMAMIQAGHARTTEDIDLLIETTVENERRVLSALMYLPDQAAKQLQPGEVSQYSVIRVADEIVVDLMKSACGIRYADALVEVISVDVGGVSIPMASETLLWRMKQTGRDKDIPDLIFLRERLNKDHPSSRSARHTWNPLRALLKLLRK